MRRNVNCAAQNFSYVFLPGTKICSLVDWQLLVEEHCERENICCLQLQGVKHLATLLEAFKENFSKAVVLINTSDDYNLSSDLTCNLEEIHLPVVLVTRSDGEQILHCLQQGEMESEAVCARIEADDAEPEMDDVKILSKDFTLHQQNPSTVAGAAATCKTVNMQTILSETITPLAMQHMNVLNDVSFFTLTHV